MAGGIDNPSAANPYTGAEAIAAVRGDPELLGILLKGGNVLHVPTNTGWNETKVGSGSSVQDVTYQLVSAGAAASSSVLLWTYAMGFSPYDNAHYSIDWARKLYLILSVSRSLSDSEAVARIQLKDTYTVGALAQKGIGVRLDNMALVGESYGTELGTVDLGVTLTSQRIAHIAVVLAPSVPRIEWWVSTGSGLVLRGAQTVSARIPQSPSGDYGFLVHSIANGATGGVDVASIIFHPAIWQEE